jgi:hypothetical protein
VAASRTLLILAVASAVAVLLLSFVPGWLIHDRTVLGEGYRHVLVELSAWKTRALPVTGLGVLAMAVAGAMALGRLAWGIPAWPAQLASVVSLGLLGGSAVPIGQRGHASLVDIGPGWVLLAALGLAGAATVASLLTAMPRRRAGMALALACIIAVPAAAAGRVVALDLAEGNGRHYADGSYTRTNSAGQAETLTLRDGTYRVDDAWSGRFAGSGLVVALTDDPACPGVRGSYHVWAAGAGDDIRWETIVDTCADGARSAQIVGTWARTP